MSTYLFIDGRYLTASFESQMTQCYGLVPPLDYREVLSHAGAARAFCYDAIDDARREKEAEEGFKARWEAAEQRLDNINEVAGFHVRRGHVRKSAGSKRREQKGVDVLLAVEAMEHAARGNMATAAFIAGDLDFEPLLFESASTRCHYAALLLPEDNVCRPEASGQ